MILYHHILLILLFNHSFTLSILPIPSINLPESKSHIINHQLSLAHHQYILTSDEISPNKFDTSKYNISEKFIRIQDIQQKSIKRLLSDTIHLSHHDILIMGYVVCLLMLVLIFYKIYKYCSKKFHQQATKREHEIKQSSLKKLGRINYQIIQKQMKSNCAICLEKNPNVATKCNHCFHGECLLKWFENNRQCPLCRYRDMFQVLVLPPQKTLKWLRVLDSKFLEDLRKYEKDGEELVMNKLELTNIELIHQENNNNKTPRFAQLE